MKGKKILAGIMAGAMLAGACISGSMAEWQEETKSGKVIRRTWITDEGLNSTAPEGYASVALSYSGTSVTEKYYDTAGQPAEAIGGYYGRTLTYGNKHRVEEIIYLDAEGKKTEAADGYARVKIVYTSAGGVTVATYYDATNTMVVVPKLGYAQVKNDYRGTTLTKTTYYGDDKKEIDTPLGYAVMVQSVNKSNKVTGIRFEHADGSAAACRDGWATMKRELDKKNREVSVKYYDMAGQMMDLGKGYGYEEKKWETDRAYTIKRFDLQGQQIAMGEGYIGLRREMNKAGQVIRETYLDENGAAKENGEGVATRKYEYDSAGRIVKVSFEGKRGDNTENTAGYAAYVESLDEDGFLVKRSYYGKNGKGVNISAGYSEIVYKYDENHILIEKEYYNVNGELVKTE